MNDILLKNCKLPSNSNQIKDILTGDNGNGERIILAIGENINSTAQVYNYNVNNRFITPAFIDTHCHLRDPGFTDKEDIITGTKAAMMGGYSAVVAMPNTNPVTDNPDTLDYITAKAKSFGHCKVYPTAAITIGQNGSELCDFKTLTQHGAIAFTDDGKPVSDASVMWQAMKICAENDYLIMSHPEDLPLAEIDAGNLAEDIAIARDILIAEATGCRLHLAHVSTKTGMRLVREAKKRGVKVTCETCPHYFSFTNDDVKTYGANAKMNPPLRSSEDLNAVIEAIIDGTVDCISTDHAPHTEAQKSQPFAESPNGITGLQTAFAAGITNLVIPNHIDLEKLIELMVYNPAKIIGLDIAIEAGMPADLNVVNLTDPFVFNRDDVVSKSYNTPFIGRKLYGKIEFMIRSTTHGI